MLRLKNIIKKYKIADSEVLALKGISLNFRKNEFVSILGPSGCGKTTTLNIIGGLDKYSSGDLFINGVSTKNYKDHDWDVYRNHKIGFIFQSYNLIPHQTVLGNVELALTIAGVSKKERQERAKKALDKVGLKGQYNKKPNQLSGGQCQRVAIARALINEPTILLADEPTGALDTVTSVQIMDLIKEISEEKLVIMVTHNPDLADKYSTRIVRLLDGEVLEDSNPFSEEEEKEEVETIKLAEIQKQKESEVIPKKAKKEKAQMGLWTTFKLSGKNLISKFKRTIMVALAGCIGIVGVSAVLSVSNGIQGYIDDMESDMLSGNPVYISSSAIDYETLLGGGPEQETQVVNPDNDITKVFINSSVQRLYNMNGVTSTNTITDEYIKYLNDMPEESCALVKYNYGYRIAPNLYTSFKTSDGKTHQMSIAGIQAVYSSVLDSIENLSAYQSMISSATVMSELPSGADYLAMQYDIVYLENGLTFEDVMNDKGSLIAVVSKSNNTLNDIELAEYGYFSQEQFLNYCYKISGDEAYIDHEMLNLPESISYETLGNKKFTWYPNDVVFTKGSSTDDLGTKYYASAYSDGSLSDAVGEEYSNYKRDTFSSEDSVELNVKCVLKLKEELSYGCLSSGGLYYTQSLSEHMLAKNFDSDICKTGRDEGGTLYNIEMGYEFKANGDSPLSLDTYYLTSGGNSLMSYISAFFGGNNKTKQVTGYSVTALGGNDIPSSIDFYCVDFAQKDSLTAYLDKWNEMVSADNFKRDENGFYMSRTTDENGKEVITYYYRDANKNFHQINLSSDGYALDYKGNKYKLVIDDVTNDSGFYQQLPDNVGEKFLIDGQLQVTDGISISAYSLASYIIFGERFYETNINFKDLELAPDAGENLYRYMNSEGQYEYIMKVPNQSYYKLALDKEGNILATQNGYEKYRYDQETDTFYKDEYVKNIVIPSEGEEEPEDSYSLKSTPLDKNEVFVLYAEENVYSYANVVKNPVYTIAGNDYTLDTLGLYIDMTNLDGLNTSNIRIDQTNHIISLTDYSGIDFYYKDETDVGFSYYYVKYEEDEFGNKYIFGNDISSFIDVSSLSAYNVSAFVAEKYMLNSDGTLQALSPNFSDVSLTITQLLDLKVIGETLEDVSSLERDDSLSINYTDTIGLIIAMVNTLIDVITYALVAFTALSLLVSTVMIGIITYVSVVERTKEIGVIRSLGGRKRDVSQLFIAETVIIGFAAGLFGIGITYLLSLIINLIIGNLTGIYTIASLPFTYALVMILLSVMLTTLSGVFPARSAARKDPVVALRTE